ncbi:Rad17 cell cycle checkpoint protein-domain-containing protein [Aspergillus crustosus]
MSDSAGPTAEDMEEEELIEDDYDSYDELFTQHFTDGSLSQFDGTVTTCLAAPLAKDASSQQKPLKKTKRFLLPSRPPTPTSHTGSSSSSSLKEELPWAQRYAPLTLGELAVHKRKVRDVELWLDDALTAKPQRNLLVLKGPAGSGKTTTVSLLADKLGFEILEWKHPSTSEFASRNYVSIGAQFDEFLNRAQRYGGLDLDAGNDSQGTVERRESSYQASQRRIILIEEFPTMSGRNFSTLAAFRVSLLRYLSMKPSTSGDAHDIQAIVPPIVMIVSETFATSDSSTDNLTVHRILGRQLHDHPSATIVEFNSIAPTFIYKALSLVLKKSGRQPTNSQAQTQSILEIISKVGDIRNAIASLEFLCLGSGHQPSRNVRAIENSRSNRNRKKSHVEPPREIAQRGDKLSLFHAVGKIVYNKRKDHLSDEDLQSLSPPDHLRDFKRPRASQVQVNDLAGEIGTDFQTFIGALHENYVPSCNGSSFTDCLDGCIRALSDSDLLCTDHKGHSRYQAGIGTGLSQSGAGVDSLRREEISFQVATRGLLFALPCPVTRQLSYTGDARRTNDLYKLSFPPTFRLLRHMEETKNLIDLCTDTFLKSRIRPSAIPLLGRDSTPGRESSQEARTHIINHENDSAVAMVAVVSRSDMILHQLPYMTMVYDQEVISSTLREVTGFKLRCLSLSAQQGEESYWELLSHAHNGFHLKSKRETSQGWIGLQAPLVAPSDDEQLVLSDDEIVDDEC